MAKSRYLNCEGREIHFLEYGDPANEPVVMWHGLARNCRDFDNLASSLSNRYHVIAPDTLGRGLSQWAIDPAREYCYAFYGAIVRALVEQLGFEKLRWVGTSMGAVIGMVVASDMLKGRVSHLVLNDIGPDIPLDAVERIRSYVGNPPVFHTVMDLEDWLRTVYAPFGENRDEFWRVMRDNSCRRMDDGRITVHYDPKIVSQFTEHPNDLDRWEAYDAINCRTMLIRGEASDVLPAAIAEQMQSRGPKPKLHTYPDFGHAPTLSNHQQINDISEFLAS
jgi:pimeloyl-ACP methyl ester carboxylesterase